MFGTYVWTNTDAFGAPFSATNHCAEWTSSSVQHNARRGVNALMLEQGPAFDAWQTQRLWTSFLGQECFVPWRLYCFADG